MESKPIVAKYGKLTQLSYELPHRVHVARIYPIKSPNGSSVFVYGHPNGIHIAWRGGRPLKDPKETKPPPQKPNGSSQDIVMIIDSDDEEPQSTAPYKDKVEFEEEDSELDPAEPYLPIIQHLDLALGTDVLDIAFPQFSNYILRTALPRIASHHILIAAACADCNVRLIAVPLLPPSRPSKARDELRGSVTTAYAGQGRWGEQMLVIGGITGHQKIPTGVALTFTPRYPTSIDEPNEAEKQEPDQRDWDLLLASHSADVSGLLHVYRLPIESKEEGSRTTYKIPTGHVTPFQVQYLPSPATAISFNISTPSSSRHSHLLVVDSKGALRIYDCLPSLKSPIRRRGRSPSAASSLSEVSMGDKGSWLMTLYPEFEAPKPGVTSSVTARRKRILDAKWILGGRGVVVLLSDGKWGIWDIEGAGPTSKKGLLRTDDGSKGIQGGATTPFALQGWVDSSAKTISARASTSGLRDLDSTLAPMTPGTRRVREESLFSGPSGSPTLNAKGGISVLPFRDPARPGVEDASIVLWHDKNAISMQSLLSYWQADSKTGGNLFGSARERVINVEGLDLRGEIVTSIDQFPVPDAGEQAFISSRGLQRDLLAAGEHRILIICPPLPEFVPETTVQPIAQPTKALTFASDQQLLQRGELDINGMERMLANMENRGLDRGGENTGSGKRKVGFLT